MAILNLNRDIYKMIKNDSTRNGMTIIRQAQYYLLLGKFVEEKPNADVESLKKSIQGILNKFKTTG